MSEIDENLFERDINLDLLLDELELDLMFDNITDQINGDSPSRTDFLSVVISKFDTILNRTDDPTITTELKAQIIDFCERIIRTVEMANDLMLDDTSFVDSLGIKDVLTNIYHFFVLDREAHVTDFFVNYVLQNKEVIVSSMGIGSRAKDITSLATKKRNMSKVDIAILSNISEIVQFIIDLDVEPSTFIDTIYDGDYYTDKIKEYVDYGIINGNFVPLLINDVTDNYSDNQFTDIRNKIRTAIYNDVAGDAQYE